MKSAAAYSAIVVAAALIGTLGVAGCKATVETPGPAVQGPAGAPGAAGMGGMGGGGMGGEGMHGGSGGGAQPQGSPSQGMMGGKQTTARAGDLAAGKASFTTFCVSCHGDSGKGDGPAGAGLKTKPRDFTDCADMTPMPDDMLSKVIKDGGAASSLSTDMPAWKDAFEDPEIKDLVAYVRSFCKK